MPLSLPLQLVALSSCCCCVSFTQVSVWHLTPRYWWLIDINMSLLLHSGYRCICNLLPSASEAPCCRCWWISVSLLSSPVTHWLKYLVAFSIWPQILMCCHQHVIAFAFWILLHLQLISISVSLLSSPVTHWSIWLPSANHGKYSCLCLQGSLLLACWYFVLLTSASVTRSYQYLVEFLVRVSLSSASPSCPTATSSCILLHRDIQQCLYHIAHFGVVLLVSFRPHLLLRWCWCQHLAVISPYLRVFAFISPPVAFLQLLMCCYVFAGFYIAFWYIVSVFISCAMDQWEELNLGIASCPRLSSSQRKLTLRNITDFYECPIIVFQRKGHLWLLVHTTKSIFFAIQVYVFPQIRHSNKQSVSNECNASVWPLDVAVQINY